MKKILLLILLSLSLTGCTTKKPEMNDSSHSIQPENIIKVQQSVINDYYEASGTVKAKNSANIAGKILARVESVNIDEGDSVQKGQLLVVLDNTDIMAKTRSAEAAYNEAVKNKEIAQQTKSLAQTTYERYKNIYTEKALTKQELDEATARKNIAQLNCKLAVESMNRAKAALDEAKSVLAYSRIYAPISGIVTSKNIDVGDTAAPGQVLLTVKDINNLEIVSEVDETYINKVSKGDVVKLNNEAEAEISEVISSVDPVTRAFKIKIQLTDTELNDGQYVRISVPVGKRETIMIPKAAVVKKGQLEGVYGPDNKFKLIKTGKAQGDMVEVLSGLEAGEELLWNE